MPRARETRSAAAHSRRLLAVTMPLTLYDTKYSLYCQLVRCVLHENGVPFESKYISLPDGEQLEPWFARIFPAMIIPAMQEEEGGPVTGESRALMKKYDYACPPKQEALVEEVMDAAFSCDLGWFSTVAMQNKLWMWAIVQRSGLMERMVRSMIQGYAKSNPDLRDTYLKKAAISELDVSPVTNANRQGPIQACLDRMAEFVERRKEGEWVTGPEFTSADSTIAIYVQWAKWQSAWLDGAKAHGIKPCLLAFYDEVSKRESFKQTLDVSPNWVGFMWQERLEPIQRGIIAVLALTALGLGYAYFLK